jgi:serine/threonine protein phosphatase PrpC
VLACNDGTKSLALAKNQIKRTTSWQRGHRQAREAAKAAQAAAEKALMAAAPALLLALMPQQACTIAQMCRRLREVAVDLWASPSGELEYACSCFTHEGGGGGKNKENQDTFFQVQPSADVALYAVFDGHGKKFGKLAGLAACSAVRSFLCAHHRWLLHCPQEALTYAFGLAHLAVRDAMMSADASIRLVDRPAGSFLLQWMQYDEDEDGRPLFKWDAVDGGTTATVVAVLRNATLAVAGVGDSTGLILAHDAKATPTHELLLEEHSPTNLAEYVRMRALPSGQRLKCGCTYLVLCKAMRLNFASLYNPDGFTTAPTLRSSTFFTKMARVTLVLMPSH